MNDRNEFRLKFASLELTVKGAIALALFAMVVIFGPTDLLANLLH